MIQHITLNGVSHTPASSTSPDGDLALCLNLVNDDGTLTLLEKPQQVATLPDGTRALYIHETAAPFKNLICAYTKNGKTSLISIDYRGLNTNGETDLGDASTILDDITSIPTISHIGNTLVLLFDDAPMQYAVFKDNAYVSLGSVPPFVPIQFGLNRKNDGVLCEFSVDKTSWPITEYHLPGDIKITNEVSSGTIDLYKFNDITREDSEQVLSGAILSKLNEAIADKTTNPDKEGGFIFPFIVRYAYRLFDGSLVMHSYPVLMTPNSHVLARITDFNATISSVNVTINSAKGKCEADVCDLYYKILSTPELSDWEDLIQGVDIYISSPLYTYDQSGYVGGWVKDGYNAGAMMNVDAPRNLKISNTNLTSSTQSQGEEYVCPTYQFLLPTKDNAAIKEMVETCGQFYKVDSIPLKAVKPSTTNNGWTKLEVAGSTLNALTSKELMALDYNSHFPKTANTCFVYNSRINIADVSETISADVPPQCQFAYLNNPSIGYSLYTEFSTDSGTKFIKQVDALYGAFPRYYFFPSDKAVQHIIGIDKTFYAAPLREHPYLNGRVFFMGFGENATEGGMLIGSRPTDTTESITISHPNKVYTSAVENPFTFSPSNINTIGTGTIYALASATQAISQGQFGAYPLYAFTSEGIWALQVSDTGGWSSIQPVSRDVITPGTMPLSIDNAVVFFSAQGLMLIQGGEVICLSKNLSTSTSLSVPDTLLTGISDDILPEALLFPRVADLAYDYAHRRIYILGDHITWIYSLSRASWSHTYSNGAYALNEYPDMILVDGKRNILCVNGKCGRHTECEFLTRPIKFNSESLRVVRGIITRGPVDDANKLQCALYASMKGYRFSPIMGAEGKAIRRISGSPYKAHCFGFCASDIADDVEFAITGLDADVETKYTSKLR